MLSTQEVLEGSAHAELYNVFRQVDDVDLGASSISGWSLQYDQLSAGKYMGEISEIRFGALQIFREKMNRMVQQIGHFPASSTVIALPIQASDAAIFAGERVESGSMIFCPPGSSIDFRTPVSLDMVSVSIDTQKICDAFSDTGIDISEVYARPATRLCNPGQKVDAVRSALIEICSLAEQFPDRLAFPAVQRDLEDAVLLALADLLPGTEETGNKMTLAARRQLVRKACRLALETLDDSTSILELCKQVGASRRKLSYCFQDVLGISPVQYLRALRLNGARRDLKNPGPFTATVQDIAGKWGFYHHGQFSGYYREMFGECPSETLGTRKYQR